MLVGSDKDKTKELNKFAVFIFDNEKAIKEFIKSDITYDNIKNLYETQKDAVLTKTEQMTTKDKQNDAILKEQNAAARDKEALDFITNNEFGNYFGSNFKTDVGILMYKSLKPDDLVQEDVVNKFIVKYFIYMINTSLIGSKKLIKLPDALIKVLLYDTRKLLQMAFSKILLQSVVIIRCHFLKLKPN